MTDLEKRMKAAIDSGKLDLCDPKHLHLTAMHFIGRTLDSANRMNTTSSLFSLPIAALIDVVQKKMKPFMVLNASE